LSATPEPRRSIADFDMGNPILQELLQQFLVRLCRQPGFFGDAKHQIETLNRHARRAFAEIVEPRHEDDVA
jgi:hypothetical protein